LKKLVVAFAFGTPKEIGSNWLIGRIASRKASFLSALIFTQSEVEPDSGIEVLRVSEVSGKCPTTLCVARGAAKLVCERKYSEVWVAAARPHMPRARRDMLAALREVGYQAEVRICEECLIYPDKEWFCPKSAQARTRSASNWWSREIILLVMPFFLYRLVAS